MFFLRPAAKCGGRAVKAAGEELAE